MPSGSGRISQRCCSLAVALLALTLPAARAQVGGTTADVASATSAPTRRALLVGVQSYPPQTGWPTLAGPLTDVARLREALIDRCGFQSDNIRVLPEHEATHDGILASFDDLVRGAGPNDLLLFYFAGHGSQLPDDDGDEDDGFDETIIPIVPEDADGHLLDVRDDDVRQLIERANARTSQMVLIFDCCNSGTNVRGVVDPAAAAAAGRRSVPLAARGLKGVRARAPAVRGEAGSGFFGGELSYVALSACRSNEAAYEHTVESDTSPPLAQGLFTWSLLQELATGGAGSTADSYADLVDRVRRRVQFEQPQQTPVIEGPLRDSPPFAGGLARAAATLRVRDDHGTPVVEGGLVHGLRVGDQLLVGGANVLEHLADPDNALLSLLEVGATSSRAQWLEPPSTESLPSSRWHAVVIKRATPEGRVGVAMAADLAPAADVSAVRAAVEGSDSLRLVDEDHATLILAAVTGEGGRAEWSARTPAGITLPFKATEPATAPAEALVQLVDAWAGTQRLRAMQCSEISPVLTVESRFVRVDAAGNDDGPLLRDDNGLLRVHVGDSFRAQLTNRSIVPVFVSLLVISPDGGVTIAVSPKDERDALQPGAMYDGDRMRETVPQGAEAFYAAAPECFRWIVTTTPTDLRSLKRDPVTSRVMTRGVPLHEENPLADRSLDAWLTNTTEIRVEVEP